MIENNNRMIVIAHVVAERARQDAKWGEQNHPDGTGAREFPLYLTAMGLSQPLNISRANELARAATAATDGAAQRGAVTWADILLEEVFEALAESDPVALRVELIQVAAVATQWAEAIDRREDAA